MKRKNVKKIAFDLLENQGSIRNKDLARRAGISRQGAHYHLKSLVKSGRILAEGRGRGVRYRLAAGKRAGYAFEYACERLEEDRVWQEMMGSVPDLEALPKNVHSMLQYAFTGLLNNAIEHSGSERVRVVFDRTESLIVLEIVDEGIGIFERIAGGLGLETHLHALQELSKGKVTTLRETHTGEGIFFVSKASDVFEIEANGLRWIVDNEKDDIAAGEATPRDGTRARFEKRVTKSGALEDLFEKYTESSRFEKTRIVVKLFAIGERFVSRSEARRLVHGLDRFREVVLDFEGVVSVGQGFVDEVFRVWARRHPGIRLVPVRMNRAVAFMVERSRA